ncbi:MAG: sigma-70 family RNA polymerase sigma factor [Acidobacteriota bacterium]|nr:sigma-70 family RNA polymerase sigma factor [Acidobacteriota bacterium]
MKDEDVQSLLRERCWTEAFELLLDRYQEKVFRLVYTILKETAKAEEVTQDIFLKMWQVLPDYDGRASLSTWLYTIARNTSLSALRAESYRKTLPIEDYEPPAANWEAGQQRVEVKQLLQRLPEVQQQVITLFYLQDRSVEDVAHMLDLPEGTVKSHLHRARQALADLMRS